MTAKISPPPRPAPPERLLRTIPKKTSPLAWMALVAFLLLVGYAFGTGGDSPRIGQVIVAALTVFVGGVIYSIPTMVAVGRRHHNVGPIVTINFFLGWTLIGWVVALAMAVSEAREG